MARAFGSIVAAILAAAVPADALAILNNDFTRANSTFMKRRFEESKMNAMQGRKARDADKKVEKKTFEDIGDVSHLREMKPHVEEGLPGKGRPATGRISRFPNIPARQGATFGAERTFRSRLKTPTGTFQKNTSGKSTSTSATPSIRNFSATSTPNSWRCPCAKSTNSIFANPAPTSQA